MKYMCFTASDRAHQEFYIRHLDGSPISSEAERQRVIQCLQDVIERRASEGLGLELCVTNQRGLLADLGVATKGACEARYEGEARHGRSGRSN